MVTQQNFRIVGTGSCLPSVELTAEEIDRRLGKPLGWTRENVGVLTRYECTAPEDLLTMGHSALEAAMLDAGVDWSEIDYLIDGSTSKVRPIPNNACHLQERFGGEASGVPCVDVQSTCLGAIVAINIANALFATAAYRNIAIVVSERALAGVNWQQPESAALVSDGAAAMVLRRVESLGKMGFAHETFARHRALCRVDGGGHELPVYEFEPEREAEFRFFMDGPAVFRVARRRLPPMVDKLCGEFQHATGTSRSELHVIPHQASPRSVELIRRSLRFNTSQYHVAVDRLGNMAAVSIPLMLDRLRKSEAIATGDRVMLLGTSAGYSQAALIFKL